MIKFNASETYLTHAATVETIDELGKVRDLRRWLIDKIWKDATGMPRLTHENFIIDGQRTVMSTFYLHEEYSDEYHEKISELF